MLINTKYLHIYTLIQIYNEREIPFQLNTCDIYCEAASSLAMHWLVAIGDYSVFYFRISFCQFEIQCRIVSPYILFVEKH